jgi:hypothetical protein
MQKLFQPFDRDIQFIMMAAYLVVAIVWFAFLQYYRHARPRISDVLLDTLRMQLAISLPRNVVDFHERLLIVGFLVYGFIIISCYQTLLISNLMSPGYLPDLQTLAEFNRTMFDLYDPYSEFKLRANKHLINITFRNQELITNTTLWGLKNSQLVGSGFGYLTTDRVASFFLTTTANIRNGRPLMHKIDEGMLFAPSCYRLLRNSPYQMIISSWINRFREAGVYQKFDWDSFYEVKREKLLETQESMDDITDEKAEVQFSDVEPAFLLLGFGCAIASITFVIELIYYRIEKAVRKRLWSKCVLQLFQPEETVAEGELFPWMD